MGRTSPPKENQPDYAFVAVLSKRGKVHNAEAAFGEQRSVMVGRKELGGARPGDLVVLRDTGRGRGRVTRRLGKASSLPVVMEGILEYYRVPRGFSAGAQAEAEALAGTAAPTQGEAGEDEADEGRRDLTGLMTFTIDPDEARDFDDAISLVDGPGVGEVTLYVHIADVSHFVTDGSALDREARRKAVSVYLPLGVEPMLPPALSTDICSLRPGLDRKCVTVEMVFPAGTAAADDDAPGEADGSSGKGGFAPARVHFYRSLIRSHRRLTYNEVDDHLGGRVRLDEKSAGLLERCRQLAGNLRRGRYGRGALAIETFEPEFRLSGEGEVVGVSPMPASESHALIEEFMIAANEAVARFLERRDSPCIYRVHEEPDPAAVDALFDLMQDLGVATPSFSLEEASLQRAGAAVRDLLASRDQGRLAGSFFTETVLRSLKRAHYQEQNLGHYGLASKAYLHFTSPIRRYPDLVVHRSLLAALGITDWSANRLDLEEIAQQSSDKERRAAKVEHTGDDVVLANLLDRQLFEEGWDRRFEGEIISLIPSGLFLRFEEVYEGFVPARNLRGDYYILNDKGSALVGRRSGRPFRLGDYMTVRVVRIDKLRGKVELEPAR